MTRAPKPYQEQGIDFLAPADAAILGDDAGLGKSMQMIRAAEKRGARRILVTCPAIGRVSWADQFATWQTRTPPTPVCFYPDQTAGIIPSGPLVLIVTFEWLGHGDNGKRALAAARNAEPFDVLFVDEGQYLKTPGAKRTKVIYGPRLDLRNGIAERAFARWLASATLTPNHAGELYPHLRALFPDILRGLFGQKMPTQMEFVNRFCTTAHTPFGVQVTGNNKNTIPDLARALKPHMLARRKEDVLPDLSPIQNYVLPFEIGAKAKNNKDIDNAISNTLDRVVAAGVPEDDDVVFNALRSMASGSEHVATRRRELGCEKVAPAVLWISDFLTNTRRKLVVFAHHREVIEALARSRDLARFQPVSIYGGTSSKEKSLIVSTFQSDPAVRLFIGQTISAGTSITLTAASDVLLLEPDWTPINNYQAISRCHRIGQMACVMAYFAYAAGTIDERIVRILRRKAEDFALLFGGQIRGALDATALAQSRNNVLN